ncbi:MAG: SEC-C domain-containing protein [Bacilli bacterium]|nr:SEC-C domain-containing protein [Bacilli bacterium]
MLTEASKCIQEQKRAIKCSRKLPKTQKYKPCGSGKKYKQCCGK